MVHLTDIQKTHVANAFFLELLEQRAFKSFHARYREGRLTLAEVLQKLKLDNGSLKYRSPYEQGKFDAKARQEQAKRNLRPPWPERYELPIGSMLISDLQRPNIFGSYPAAIIQREFHLGHVEYVEPGREPPDPEDLCRAQTKGEALRKAYKQCREALEGWPVPTRRMIEDCKQNAYN